MRFRIDADVFQLFPQYCRGLVVATGIDNSRPCPEIEKLLREQEERVRLDPNVDPATHPRLQAWKQAYLKFGANPNKFTPSIVFLAKQAKAGKPLRSISPVVDVFNTISIKYLVPAGGDDLDAVQGDLTLGRAVADESFAPLFKPDEVEHPEPGEIILVNRQSKRVLCRRWNWRNADFSKITPQTTNLAVNVDGMIPAITRPEIEQAAEELKQLLLQFCGGSVSIHYLEAQNPEAEVAL
ncbi:MAG: phenylalanine--tRNA ligase beta subunit-related protein [Acidobacteriota bacterium]|jgi:DNA/RNA-binding domain of Phe-tRNA-synthetase-like protein